MRLFYGDNFVCGQHTYEVGTNITGGSWHTKVENVFSNKSDYVIGKNGSLNLDDHNQIIAIQFI